MIDWINRLSDHVPVRERSSEELEAIAELATLAEEEEKENEKLFRKWMAGRGR